MLGFLGSIRDMKTALASGMILLITAWLIFINNIHDTPASYARWQQSTSGRLSWARWEAGFGRIHSLHIFSAW